jgi:prolyl 4-hydroxylase
MGSILIIWLSFLRLDEQKQIIMTDPSLAQLTALAKDSFPKAIGGDPVVFTSTWTQGDSVKEYTVTDVNIGLLFNDSVVTLSTAGSIGEEDQGETCDASESFPGVFEVVSEHPRVFYYPNFLSGHECDEMIRLGEEFIKPTQVTADGGKVNTEVRSSKAHFLTWEQEAGEVPQSIKKKVQGATKFSQENMESLQVQRYGAPRKTRDGGMQYDFYKPHVDSMYGNDRRIATMIFYLSDTAEGGDTVFPWVSSNSSGRAGYALDPQPAIEASVKSYNAACKAKRNAPGVVKVKPKRGAAVLFYTLLATGELDPLSIHSSCPVIEGTKWIAQQWIKESWHEPRESPRLLGMWELDELLAEEEARQSSKGSYRPNVLTGSKGFDKSKGMGVRDQSRGSRSPLIVVGGAVEEPLSSYANGERESKDLAQRSAKKRRKVGTKTRKQEAKRLAAAVEAAGGSGGGSWFGGGGGKQVMGVEGSQVLLKPERVLMMGDALTLCTQHALTTGTSAGAGAGGAAAHAPFPHAPFLAPVAVSRSLTMSFWVRVAEGGEQAQYEVRDSNGHLFTGSGSGSSVRLRLMPDADANADASAVASVVEMLMRFENFGDGRMGARVAVVGPYRRVLSSMEEAYSHTGDGADDEEVCA